MPHPPMNGRSPKRDSWRQGKTTAERGYGARWQKARKIFLASNLLCERCKAEGRAEPATVVNHRKPHKGNQTLFWDATNWEALCAPHHDRDAQREERGRRVVGCDENGWPIG